ncbi:hypothetical protein PybrP1_001234 [[Pythium] brassicae (nom. inval.)]|nr:hypothetical protein PybrP1_001234 [[Pythium] brassicae (nom. inval.)]
MSPSSASSTPPQESEWEQQLDADDRKLLLEERSCIFETRVESAARCRDRGSQAFKAADVARAVRWYDRAIHHVDFDEGTWHFEVRAERASVWQRMPCADVTLSRLLQFLDKHRDAVNEVRLPVYLNLAACYLHESAADPAKAAENAELALAIDPQNTKALYRGGKAHLLRDDLDAARKKLTLAAKNQPNDRSIREALATLKVRLAEQKSKEKETWGGRLASAAKKKADSEGEDEDGSAATDDSSKVSKAAPALATPTPASQSDAAFWVVALLFVVLAALAGFFFTS